MPFIDIGADTYSGKAKNKDGKVLPYKNLFKVTIDNDWNYSLVDHHKKIEKNRKNKLIKVKKTAHIEKP
ncbi:hypothetical protein [Liquorilactobacillus uvarum]|uniref:Uncharacterized protein n=1 Tax=Liquorilactobacillus uvarum DSM 19971 TaxID=1423812 RepID=A0A0R1PXM8_9LACO|nr:hypothetical protein [Liquorilactobacillus uvarum]KRL32840.1 hypothetical protein FD20_GL002211 [Liquorilactobacillus uvarum DSM 19971]